MAIVSWNHKGLKQFFETGNTKGIDSGHEAKLRRILTTLNTISSPDELRIPAYCLHQLKPKKDDIWAVKVNGNWRVTFRFKNGNAEIVDYLDYH